MRILLVGVAKSGNYWLQTILNQILDQAGTPDKSYIRSHPIHPIAKTWRLSVPEQADIDFMDITATGCFCRISSIFREPIEDLDKYIGANRVVRSHSPFSAASAEVYKKFDKVVYIVRDPRDVFVSQSRYFETPYMRKYYPLPARGESPLRPIGQTLAWAKHVAGHIQAMKSANVHVVFFERLRLDFATELDLLLEYLAVPFTEDQKLKIMDAVSIERMRKDSAQHVRKGQVYGWATELPPRKAKAVTWIARPLLSMLNYPFLKVPEIPPLPRLSHLTAAKQLKGRLRTTQLRGLFLAGLTASPSLIRGRLSAGVSGR